MSSKTNGKGHTHQKRHNKRDNEIVINEISFAKSSEGEFYAKVAKPLGSGQFNVVDNEGREVRASITRSFMKGPKRELINPDDYVKIQPGISKDQYFINHKYNKNDIDKLYSLGLIGKPKNDTSVEASDLIFEAEPSQEGEKDKELTLEDIWDDL
jgi:translation initiation factor IF-1